MRIENKNYVFWKEIAEKKFNNSFIDHYSSFISEFQLHLWILWKINVKKNKNENIKTMIHKRN